MGHLGIRGQDLERQVEDTEGVRGLRVGTRGVQRIDGKGSDG